MPDQLASDRLSGITSGKAETRIIDTGINDVVSQLNRSVEIYERYRYILHLRAQPSLDDLSVDCQHDAVLQTLLGSQEIVASIFDAFARLRTLA